MEKYQSSISRLDIRSRKLSLSRRPQALIIRGCWYKEKEKQNTQKNAQARFMKELSMQWSLYICIVNAMRWFISLNRRVRIFLPEFWEKQKSGHLSQSVKLYQDSSCVTIYFPIYFPFSLTLKKLSQCFHQTTVTLTNGLCDQISNFMMADHSFSVQPVMSMLWTPT